MELALSLGDTSKPFSSFLDKSAPAKISSKDLGFCMGLSNGFGGRSVPEKKGDESREDDDDDDTTKVSSDQLPVQLDLLPFSPVPRSHHHPPPQLRFPWLTDHLVPEPGSRDGFVSGRGLDVNRFPVTVTEEAEDGTALSSPNSTVSSFQMEFCMRNGSSRSKRDLEVENHHHHHLHDERASSRVSDDEENGLTRKKLRLSKEQSAFLEESFKEHNTLNPKQKLALAKQLNLRPRQVEVWFQNRRARTKLKQTEVDCEYLKRCCETLTEENRRLQKELQELRALKSSQPFYMQLPATTLTMCPSCERVATTTTSCPATTTTAVATTTNNNDNNNSIAPLQLAKPAAAAAAARLYPFSHAQPHMSQAQAPQSTHEM